MRQDRHPISSRRLLAGGARPGVCVLKVRWVSSSSPPPPPQIIDVLFVIGMAELPLMDKRDVDVKVPLNFGNGTTARTRHAVLRECLVILF